MAHNNSLDYGQVGIKCPFFSVYTRKELTIHCEEDYSMSFPDADSAKVYKKAYCSSEKGYTDCLIARVLEQKYDPITAELRNRP